MNFNCWLLTVWALFLYVVCLEIASVVAKDQYHIQTDEGPERYFRFQTHNGQFRKEKRLQDGTVIGTEAWIDAAGYLRLKDYIADKQGYRILKSKVVYVGQNTAIEDAMKSAKTVPAQAGTLVDGKNGLYSSNRPNSLSSNSVAAIYSAPLPKPVVHVTATEKPILGYLSPAEAAKLEPTPFLGFDHYPNEVPPAEDKGRKPALAYVRPYGEKTYYDGSAKSSAIQLPSIDMQPPLENKRRRPIRPIAVANAKPPPIAANELVKSGGYQYSTPAPFYAPAEANRGYYYSPASNSANVQQQQSSPHSLPSDVNALEGLLPPYTTPLYQRQRAAAVSQAGVYGTRLVADSNDITVTQNGYRYVLPHQYHEEEQINSSKKAGSFGYVDPFGIRRVVYYNASPEKGFVHRNHNQYVGLGAAPYDPPQPSET